MTCRFILIEGNVVNRALAFVSFIEIALEKERMSGGRIFI